MGLTPSTADAILAAGVDVITSGNHIWDKREIYPYLESNDRVLRPHNYGTHQVPGRGMGRLPRARWQRPRGDQPAGPNVHAADREPVHRRRRAARRGFGAAASGPPRRFPLRADIREERPRAVSRRQGQRRRRYTHARCDGRRADPPRRHRLSDRSRDDRSGVERDRVQPEDRVAAVPERPADAVRGGGGDGGPQRAAGRYRPGDGPSAAAGADPAASSSSNGGGRIPEAAA